MPPIFCVSDLHLCDRGPRDNFFARGEKRFFDFLDYVQDQKGELYILGDLFDWWQCNLSASVLAYKDLLDRLITVGPLGTLWVVGNHDNAFVKFISATPGIHGDYLPTMSKPFEATIGGKRFAFLHGHEADPTCRDLNPGIGELTAIMSAMIEDHNKGPNKNGKAVEDLFISALEAPLNIWRHVTHQTDRARELIDNVEAYRKSVGADVVVSGHTHEQLRISDNYFNCGCWCRDRDGYTKIDEDGTVSMWTWNGKQPESFDRIAK